MSSELYSLSIVVPCYNEGGNIPFIFSRFNEVIGDRKNIEVLLVNNGSTDNSKEIFEREMNLYNNDLFQVVNVDTNQGYGFGILSGLEVAKGNVLAWTHADLQTDPNDVIIGFDLFQNINSELVFIKGKRKKRKFSEAFFTWAMQVISSIVLKTPLNDINAQPKIFSRSFYQEYLTWNAPYDFSLDLYILFWAKRRLKIIEIPVFFNKRIYGEAKGGGSFKTRINLIKRTFKYIFELRKKIISDSI